MRRSNPPKPIPLIDPLIGQRLGEYEVLEAIGEGGMGVVYRGLQPVIQKRVAIKVLKPNMAGDALQVRRLADEAVAVNSIRHRNIIDIFSFGQLPDGRPYIVMEFLEGQPFDVYLQAGGKLALGEALGLLIALCAPLGAAHRAGVIHRDLKPSNIFVCVSADGDRYLKLLDFGLAKKGLSLDGTTAQTSRVQITGTPNYMAPEQAKAENVSPRTDLYALGVMAYELVTGELPYTSPGPVEVLMLHVSGDIPSPKALVPNIPAALDSLIVRLLAKRAEDRPQSAEEVRAELISIARSLELTASYEPIDPVSGEYATRQLRPMVTPDGLKPASQMSVDLHAATFVSRRALPPRRWPYVAGAVLVGVLIAVAVGLSDLVNKAQALPPAVVTRPPLLVTPPPVVTPVVVAPIVTPPVVVTPEVVAPEIIQRPKPSTRVPTAVELQHRIAALEASLARATPPGEEPDPSALTLLRKYKVEATMLNSTDDRHRLAESLKNFERTFLHR